MTDWFYKNLNYFIGLVGVFIFFVLTIFAAGVEIKAFDLWLHIATGRFIVNTQSIPQVDFLSATVAGKPWINHEWLFQSLVYLIYNDFGINGLIGLQVFVVVSIFFLLFLLGFSKDQQLLPLFLLLLLLLVFQLRFLVRPDQFSLLFFTIYVFILARLLDRPIAIGLLFIVQVIWTNFHGFFILGPFIVFIILLGEILKRYLPLPLNWKEVGRLTDDEFKRLIFIFFAVVAACLCNPLFFKGAWYPISILFSLNNESKIFFHHIIELHKPITMGNWYNMHHYFNYKLLIVMSSLSFIYNRRKLDIGTLILWLFFLIFSLSAVRNLVFFALIAFLVIMINFRDLNLINGLPEKYRNVKVLNMAAILCKIILIVWMCNYLSSLNLRGYFDHDKNERKQEYGGISQRNYPTKATDFLVENNISGNVFNNFSSGAYLIGRTFPQIKVFIDGRTEVYGAEFFRYYRKIWKGNTRLFQEAVEKYDLSIAFINTAQYPAPGRIVKHLYEHQDWQLVYFDYDALIFLKDDPRNFDIIDKFKIDIGTWVTPEFDLLKVGPINISPYRQVHRAQALYDMGFPEKAKQEALLAIKIAPHYEGAYEVLGLIYLGKEDFEEAYINFRKAKVLNVSHMKIRYHLSETLLELDQLEEAKKQAFRVLSKDPNNAKTLYLVGMIKIKEGMIDSAMEYFTRAYQLSPKLRGDILKFAKKLILADRQDLAKDVLTKGLKKNSDDLELQLLLESLQ